MAGRVLLDSNIIVAFFNGESAVEERLEQRKGVNASVISIGELYGGAMRSLRRDENITRIERFIEETTVLTCNLETSLAYGQIKADLMRRGTPIPDNDIWIAAQALQHDLTVVSRDAHFQRVSGLSIETWT